MRKQKKIVLKYTPAAMALEILSFALLIAMLLVIAMLYSETPEPAPRSFDLAGRITDWGPKVVALVTPIISTIIYVIISGIGLVFRRYVPENNQQGIMAAVLMLLLALKAEFMVYSLIETYAAIRAVDKLPGSTYILAVCLVLTIAAGARAIYKRKIMQKAD